MKRTIFLILIIIIGINSRAAETESSYKYNIILTGASFASYQNSWFEKACRQLNARAINRAVGGEAIANTANRMNDGTLYTPEELEQTDALVIMQVHNRDVFDSTQLKEKYTDYKLPFDRSNYAAAFDYVIKRYITECYELKNNPRSKYYKSATGKPAIIVLCTAWHDGRTIYNTSVRKLAAKWGLPLVEFDQYIGFSRNAPHPVTGQQTSLLYATDNEVIDGVKFGKHPIRGEQSYIQQRMAAIFQDTMLRILPLK